MIQYGLRAFFVLLCAGGTFAVYRASAQGAGYEAWHDTNPDDDAPVGAKSGTYRKGGRTIRGGGPGVGK
jgi:hypothetical protein